jgi:hypothetical protein
MRPFILTIGHSPVDRWARVARLGVPLITCTPAGPASRALPWTCVVRLPARGRPGHRSLLPAVLMSHAQPSSYLRNVPSLVRSSLPAHGVPSLRGRDMEPVSAGHVAPLLITCGAHVPCPALVVLAECPEPGALLITCARRPELARAGHGAGKRGSCGTAPYYLRCPCPVLSPRRNCGMSRALAAPFAPAAMGCGTWSRSFPGGIGNSKAADVADPRGNGSVT